MSESAAKQRAAARREAILNARGNRLSKLTSSARGDAAASLYEDTPSPIRSSPAAAELLGEEPSMNMPRPSPSPTPASRRTSRLYRSSPGPQEDMSGIPPEQEAMMRALLASMGGAAASPGLPSLAPGLTPPGINTPTAGGPVPSDPFAAMLAQLTAQQQLPSSSSDGGAVPNPLAAAFGSSSAAGGPGQAIAVAPKPKTLFQKLLPLLHAVSVLCLLAYFVFKFEPLAYEAGGGTVPGSMTGWSRWSSLVRAKSDEGGIQAVPIFAAFTTLQIILHSIRIYNEPRPQPPAGILGMVISNLPPPLPNVIQTALKYFQMGGAVMDDLSVLVFAVGVIVWGAGLFAVP